MTNVCQKTKESKAKQSKYFLYWQLLRGFPFNLSLKTYRFSFRHANERRAERKKGESKKKEKKSLQSNRNRYFISHLSHKIKMKQKN